MFASFARGVAIASFAIALASTAALAQWTADPTQNKAVSRLAGWEQFPRAVTDGDGGVIVVWQAQAGGSSGYDLYASRIDWLGFQKWTAEVVTDVRDQRDHQLVSDGAGGAIVVWEDERVAQLNPDIYAQRLSHDGTALWSIDGVPICSESSIQAYPRIAADGAGGAVIAWRDSRNYSWQGVDIYAQRVNAVGVPQWTADGVPVCTAPGNQMDPGITSVGGDAVVVAWSDQRLGSTNADVFAQKLDGNGAPQWAVDGVGAANPANQYWYNNVDPVLPDGTGGAFVVFEDDYYTTADIDLHVVRFAADGSLPWGAGGRTICAATGIQRLAQPVVTGGGAVVVPWTDYRFGSGDPDVYAQRFDASGSMAWPTNGLEIAGTTAEEMFPLAVRERGSGVLLLWGDKRGGDYDLFAQRYDAAGAAVWPYPADITTAGADQVDPVGVLSGFCGAVVVWRDNRWFGAIPPDNTSADIYAQRVYCDGSLAQNEIVVDSPNGGEAWPAHTYRPIEYHGVQVEGQDVVVEYSTDGGASWSPVTTVFNSGAHHLMDWWVPNTPSTNCRVRASVARQTDFFDVSDGPFTILLDPAGVDDASPPSAVSLRAVRPNPARSVAAIAFGLPAAGAVSLRVHDVSGRVVRTLRAGTSPAGWQHATWVRDTDAGGRAGPGIYWIVLRAGGRTVTQRVAVMD